MIAQVSDSMVKIVCGFLLWQQRFYLFEDAVQFLLRLCPQHGYPGVAEIGNPFEERACCQVAAHVQYAPSFIQQVDAVFHFLAEYVQPPFGTRRRELDRKSVV